MQRFVLNEHLRVAEHLFSMGNYHQFVLEAIRIVESIMKAKLEIHIKMEDAKSKRAKRFLQKLSPTGTTTRLPFSALINACMTMSQRATRKKKVTKTRKKKR